MNRQIKQKALRRDWCGVVGICHVNTINYPSIQVILLEFAVESTLTNT